MKDHTALVKEARESREALGYQVFTEDQNFFTLRGKSATLAGKPDLIAVKGKDLVIVDAKTGRPNPAHSAQVMIYQYAVPRALEQYRGMEFRGHVIYPGGKNVGIPASRVDQSSSTGSAISSGDSPRRTRPGGYLAPPSAGGATSPPPTARSG